MKKLYIQSIALFGLVIPIFVALLIILIITFIKSSMMKDFETNSAAYENEQTIFANVNALKAQAQNQGSSVDDWQELTSGDNYQKIISELGSAANDSKTKSMLITQQARSRSTAEIVDEIDSPAEGMTLSIKGTYAELQKTFLKIERQHPNLFATNLQIKPDGKVLELNANYIIWKSDK